MAFLPIFDRNPRVWLRYPWVTWGLIALNVYLFIEQTGGGQHRYLSIIYGFGFIPAVFGGMAELPPELQQVPAAATLVTSLFLHGNLTHLIGNMLFLWVFGDNVEDSMGHGKFLIFYLICGLAATLAHYAMAPGSTVPVIGASGAISGVLGAYLLLYPKSRILVPVIIIPLFLPAWLLLIFWFTFQLIGASTPGPEAHGGIAWWAHIGGFIAGLLLIVFFKRPTVRLLGGEPPPRGVRLRPREKWRRPGGGRGGGS